MKFDIMDILKGTSFFPIGEKTALLKGKIRNRDIMKMRNWVQSINIAGGQGFRLLIDSSGGISDPKLLEDMFKVPIHTHVIGDCSSFAALIALMGTYRTCYDDEEAYLMFHRAEWSESKESDEVAECSDILFKHRYNTLSMIAKLLPAGEVKDVICGAMLDDGDTYVSAQWLFEEGALDDIVDYTAADLGLYDSCKEWYDRTYNSKEPSDG